MVSPIGRRALLGAAAFACMLIGSWAALAQSAGTAPTGGASGGPEALDATDEYAERRRVDEGGLRQVHDDLLLARLDQLDHALLELGRGVEVDLAAKLNYVSGVVDGLVFDMEVHVSPC